MQYLQARIQSETHQDPAIAHAQGEDGALWLTDSRVLTPAELAEWLPRWEAELPVRGELLASRRRHDVYRLDTEEFGPLVLKYTNPGKTKRRSAVAAWLTGRRLDRALPGVVAQPLGAVDRYQGDAVVAACLICRYVDAQPLPEPDEGAELGELADRVGRFQARLHASGVYLQDCRMGNMLAVASVAEGGEEGAETEGLTIVDLEALAEGRPSCFNAARLLLKLRLSHEDFARVWAAYVEKRGADLGHAERFVLWWIYLPLRRVRHKGLRFYRGCLRPMFGLSRHGTGSRTSA
ncbi:phosphotransferase [Halorhodospira halophila]|uniref:Aminoglycoside phosphotransferase domain-containing protein n=1 Tax=Halorhodospira halophila (strain DSM 244 / SL1) TaxID=349124 RepID=A1WV64_HALHL|nr:phosphotransferase [Halorhodospira halophila]ABM61576.1 hypothetical protein Hhal_0800 [Halorhodospira halophila SL1]